MKKLVLFAFAMVAVTFASCGNKQATATIEKTDSIAVDSVEVVVDSAAVVDSFVVADTTAISE